MNKIQDIKDLLDLNINVESYIEGTVFKWKDALYLHTTDRYAIPNPTIQVNIIKQAHALMPVFSMLGGFKITSWYRPEEYNKLIGGSVKSSHTQGSATDFQPSHVTIEEAKKKIQASHIYPGGGELNSTNWIHLDLIHKAWFTA